MTGFSPLSFPTPVPQDSFRLLSSLRRWKSALPLAAATFLTGGYAIGAPYTWTATTNTTPAVDGSGTWDTISNNWIDNTGTAVPFVSGTTSAAVFGGLNGSSAGSGIATVTVPGNLTADSITFNAPASPLTSWLLTGSTISLANTGNAVVLQSGNAEIRSNLTNNTLNTANLNVVNNGAGTLTLSGNTVYGADGPKFTNNAGGTIVFTNVVLDGANNGRWLQINGGNYVFNGTNSYNAGGIFQIGSGGGSTTVTISPGATYTNNVTTNGNINIGHNGASVATLNVQGTVNFGGDMLVGEAGAAQATLNVSGAGAVNIPTGRYLYIAKNNNVSGASGIVNISGGTLTTQGIDFGSTNTTSGTNSAQLNITGGSLVLTTNNGIHTGAYSSVNENNPAHTATDTQINLGGGAIVANSDWSSNMNMTLTGTNGNITFRAASNEVTPTAHNITLGGVLSGTGGLIKTGGGTLTLNGVNAYAGTTAVQEGVLITGATGSLGADLVSIAASAGLTLGNFTSINDTGTLSVDQGATITLALGSGTEVVGKLFNSTTGTFIAADTYTADQLNALFGGGATFVGGSDSHIQVLAVPEPGVTALALLGLAGLGVARSRRWA
jgi:autotransporter-associated beta strand protein